jgi:hypothetical protein
MGEFEELEKSKEPERFENARIVREPKPFKKKESHFLDKEIDIDFKLNPRKAIKGTVIVVIVLFIFFLGRLSAPEYSPITEEIIVEEKSGGFGKFFSSFTGLFLSDESLDAEAPETNETEPPVEEETTEEAEETIEETEETVEEEEEEELIITSPYSKVSFAIKNVRVEWMETWGKITFLDFTLKNNEGGTVKPAYFSMMVEGYPDESSRKKVPLPLDCQEVKSKISITSSVNVPGGFNYHPKTTGNLDDVEIRFILFDFEDKPMASYRKNFDLSG